MISANDPKLSIAQQCKLLSVNRSVFYYKPKPITAEQLEIMRLIDEEYLKHPESGSRTLRNYLRRLGYKINRKKVQRLMRLMGLEAIYPKPHTSRPHPDHKVYPYLLKNLEINRPIRFGLPISVCCSNAEHPMLCVRSCMRDGGTDPPRSACRGRPQTTLSGIGQKPLS
jgi:hypothetical protein